MNIRVLLLWITRRWYIHVYVVNEITYFHSSLIHVVERKLKAQNELKAHYVMKDACTRVLTLYFTLWGISLWVWVNHKERLVWPGP